MISNTVKQLEVLYHYCAQDSYHNGNAQQGHNSSHCFTVFDIMLYSSLFTVPTLPTLVKISNFLCTCSVTYV